MTPTNIIRLTNEQYFALLQINQEGIWHPHLASLCYTKGDLGDLPKAVMLRLESKETGETCICTIEPEGYTATTRSNLWGI